MEEKQKPTNPEENKKSRRGFLNASAIAAAAAFGAAPKAQAEPGVSPIRVPDAIPNALNTPGKPANWPMRGAQIFARVCKDEGLAALFCCPGNYEIINSIVEEGIPAYGGRTEGSMCSAADGFARVTGEITACSGTEGPGFTNMIMNIAAANAARTPLLVLASNKRIADDDSEMGIQTCYQQPTTEGMRKYGKRLIDPKRVYEYAAYAFRQLKTGVPSPVHLDFPGEISNARFKDASELRYFHDKAKYKTDARPHPDPKRIATLAGMIKAAQRPIIVASTGVFYSRAWDALKAAAEKAEIAVVESGPSRGHFSDAHPLSASTAPGALASADLVIFIGQYSMPNVGECAFSPDAKYVRIDPDASDIGRNWPIDFGIVSCEKAALEALASALPKMTHEAWVAELAAERKKFEDQNAEYYKTGLGYTDAVHPAVMAQELSDFLYRGDLARELTTVVAGGYGIARYMRRYLRAHRPGQICNGAYQYGAIGPDCGYAFGAAAAVQLGAGPQAPYKGAPVVAITGDAGFAYSGMEIETMAKYKMPVVLIVYNNNAWGIMSQGKPVHMYLFQENLRYDKIGESLGARGEYVTKPADFLPALKRSYQIAARERVSTVINCQAKREFWTQQFAPGMLGKVEPGCMAYSH
ncbi:MAG: twin-arginine translocation signal domain-containing protein [Bryobacteraceae bacterium]|nr:twin-arginine translocation signal domain-containing protein [Bryobacteraceae bacterium]